MHAMHPIDPNSFIIIIPRITIRSDDMMATTNGYRYSISILIIVVPPFVIY